ncbi:MAG: inositol monophosphatase family protein [Chloroflexi bacterium]|nr:inositol monophosphatase family protein [Chloroflexota bacterium]
MPNTPTSADPAALLVIAVELAVEAAALVAERTAGRAATVGTKSSATDLVTAVDRDVEALITARLRTERPHDAIVGEEGADHDGASGVRWLIDPIDGTTNFVYGFPAYAVSIGVEANGEAVAGVVFDIAHTDLYAAARGLGATCNGSPIAVSDRQDLASALIGTGFGYVAEVRRRQGAVLAQVLPHVRDIRRSGSAALDLCWVARGRLDGYYEDGVQAWDTAAGELLVREAGGRTGRMPGATERGYTIAAAPGIFDALHALLVEAPGAAAV